MQNGVTTTDLQSLHLVATTKRNDLGELVVGEAGMVDVVGDSGMLELRVGIVGKRLDNASESGHLGRNARLFQDDVLPEWFVVICMYV